MTYRWDFQAYFVRVFGDPTGETIRKAYHFLYGRSARDRSSEQEPAGRVYNSQHSCLLWDISRPNNATTFILSRHSGSKQPSPSRISYSKTPSACRAP